MYRLYNNNNMILENEDLEVLRNYIKENNIEGELKITYVYEDEEEGEIEETYVETLKCVAISGNNDYIEFGLVGANDEMLDTYKVEIKGLEQLGMATLYNKVNQVKDDLKDLYYEHNGFIPRNIVIDLINEKMN